MKSDSSFADLSKELELLEQHPTWCALKQEESPTDVLTIMGLEGREDAHSRFIAWLLDPKGSHGLGYRPLRRFLKSLATSWTTRAIPDQSDRLKEAFSSDSYVLSRVAVTTEKYMDAANRVDVWTTFLFDDQKTPPLEVGMAIENKVDHTEGEEQTTGYWKWLVKDWRSQLPSQREVIGVYLTPLPAFELDALRKSSSAGAVEARQKQGLCASPDFVQINYQQLLDDVLAECQRESAGGPASLVSQYVRTLCYRPEREHAIMAISIDDRTKILKLWTDKGVALNKIAEACCRGAAQDPTAGHDARQTLERLINILQILQAQLPPDSRSLLKQTAGYFGTVPLITEFKRRFRPPDGWEMRGTNNCELFNPGFSERIAAALAENGRVGGDRFLNFYVRLSPTSDRVIIEVQCNPDLGSDWNRHICDSLRVCIGRTAQEKTWMGGELLQSKNKLVRWDICDRFENDADRMGRCIEVINAFTPDVTQWVNHVLPELIGSLKAVGQGRW